MSTLFKKCIHPAKAGLSMLLICIVSWSGAQTISHAEYFFDTDPGIGNGIPLTISASDPITFTETISTTGLSNGVHLLFVRTKTSTGHWSLYEVQEFTIEGGVQAAEYFFDTDPGIGNGVPIILSPNSGVFMTSVSTASLTDGEHFLFVRTRHDDNTWSLTEPHMFYIRTRIIAGEYFIDTDPGFGNGTPLIINTPSDLITITTTLSTPPLPNGDHYLFIRTKDILGHWSHFEPQLFQVEAILPIRLLNFTATTQAEQVILKWATVTEINNAYFTIEHATSRLAFREIFQVRGAGTSSQSIQYEKNHHDPVQGINYYRLKQTDLDGNFSYSNVVSATVTLPQRTFVYPNPIVDNWFIQFGSEDPSHRLLEIYDLTGRKLATYTTNGQPEIELNSEGFSPGTYILRVISSDKIEVHKLCFQ